MTKYVCLLSLVVGLCTGFCVPSAQAISIDFQPSTQTVGVNTAVQVRLVISGLEAGGLDEIVAAFDLDVHYDPGVLTATGATYGSFLDDPVDPSLQSPPDLSTPGLVDLAETSFVLDDDLLASRQPDSFILATLRFTAHTMGSSDLTFDFTIPNEVIGRNGIPLAVSPGQGNVQVVPVIIPEPGTLLLLGAGLGILAFWRRWQP